ncbi:hypothetical protein [Clostridium sp. DL1XJH146]
MKKKGVSIIEELLYAGTAMVLMLILSQVFVDMNKYNYEIVSDYNDRVYFDEFIRYIQYEIEDIENKSITINEDQLIIRKKTGDKNTIYLCEINGETMGDIYINYYKKYNSRTTKDILMRSVCDLEFYNRNELLFVEVKFDSGENFKRCVNIQGLSQDIY